MSTKTKDLQSTDEFFHVYNRGVNRSHIFFNERNFRYFRQRMLKANNPSSIEIITYCLMPNHFHLIIRQLEPFGISSFVRSVCVMVMRRQSTRNALEAGICLKVNIR